MSHQTVITAKLKNLAAIEAAARELGMAVKHDQHEINSYYRTLGDFPLVLSHAACRYDIGVVAEHDGTFSLTCDFYRPRGDAQGLGDIVGENGIKLTVLTGIHTTTMEMEAEGYTVERQAQSDGFVQLVVTQYGE